MRGEAGTTSPPPKVGGACRGSKSAPKQAFSVAFGAREPCLSVSQRQAVWPHVPYSASWVSTRCPECLSSPCLSVQPAPASASGRPFHCHGSTRRVHAAEHSHWLACGTNSTENSVFFFNPLSPSSLFPHLLLALCFALQCVKKIIKMQLMCKKMSLTFQVILKKFAIIFDRCAMRQNKHKDKTRTTELVMTIINDKSFTTHPISHP